MKYKILLLPKTKDGLSTQDSRKTALNFFLLKPSNNSFTAFVFAALARVADILRSRCDVTIIAMCLEGSVHKVPNGSNYKTHTIWPHEFKQAHVS